MSEPSTPVIEICNEFADDISTQKKRAFNLFSGRLAEMGIHFDDALRLTNKNSMSLELTVKKSVRYLAPELKPSGADGPCGLSIEFRLTRSGAQTVTLKIPVIRLSYASKMTMPAALEDLIDHQLSGAYSATELAPLKRSFAELFEKSDFLKVREEGAHRLVDDVNAYSQAQVATFIERAIGCLLFWIEDL